MDESNNAASHLVQPAAKTVSDTTKSPTESEEQATLITNHNDNEMREAIKVKGDPTEETKRQPEDKETTKGRNQANDTTDGALAISSPQKEVSKKKRKLDDCCLSCISFSVQCCECSVM